MQLPGALPGSLPELRRRALRSLRPHAGALANAREAVDRDRAAADARWERVTDLGVSSQLAGRAQGLVLTDAERARVADVRPAAGFAAAAGDALEQLHRRHGLDLWMVTEVRDGQQAVVVARGVAGMPVPPGAVQPWAESYCRQMVAGEAPRVAPRSRDVPTYAACLATERFGIAAYVGVPLLTADGTLFGTLCALSAKEQPQSLVDSLPEVELVARLLSTVLVKETAALERSYEAAQAYARVDRDGVTGLLNARGWQSRLLVEEDRCRRHGRSGSLVAVTLAAGSGDETLRAVGTVLQRVCRSVDVLARTGPEQLGVLVVECDRAEARALAERLDRALAEERLRAGVAVAGRAETGDLCTAWQEAARQVSARRPVLQAADWSR